MGDGPRPSRSVMDPNDIERLLRTLADELGRYGRSQAALARAMGFPDASYVNKIIKGIRQLKATEVAAVIRYLRETAPTGALARLGYPLIGKVGAGGTGLYEDDYAQGAASEFIEPLPGMPMEAEIIALEADGDSMAPLVMDGDLAFFGPVREDVETCLNKRVMARLADGRKFFKILKKGSQPGLFTLRSLNPTTPDIEDVKVQWVLPYRGSRPKELG